jgi:hypothetical protein
VTFQHIHQSGESATKFGAPVDRSLFSTYIQTSDKLRDHSVPCTVFEVVDSSLFPSQGQQTKGPPFFFGNAECDFTVACSRALRALPVRRIEKNRFLARRSDVPLAVIYRTLWSGV